MAVPAERMPEEIELAAEAILRGDVVVYPTETVYGLGADATDPAAVARVLDLKGRDAAKSVLVLVDSRERLREVAERIPPAAEALIEAFWPGPLTLVLPARKDLPRGIASAAGGVGVRESSHPLASALARRVGRPITSTSANPAAEPPARDVAAARAFFGERIGAYVDGGRLGDGPASTVLDLSGRAPRLLRDGAVPFERLESVLRTKIERSS